MKKNKNKNKNFAQRIKLNNNEKYLSVDSRLDPSYKNKKPELLFSHKSSLKVLIKEIKICLLDNISNKSLKNNYLLNLKQILSTFENNLSSMLDEKNNIYYYFQKDNKQKKKDLQKLIFSEELDQNQKNVKIIPEINQLKLLNFQIINEIKNIDFLIERKNKNLFQIKSNPFNISENDGEIFCIINNKNISTISNFFHEIIIKKRKKFIDKVNEKSEQDNVIKKLTMNKEYLKDKIKKYNNKNKYINSEDIINEESKEYIENTINSNILNNSKIESNFNKKKELKLRSNNNINRNIYLTNKEKFIINKLNYTQTISPKIFNICLFNNNIDTYQNKKDNNNNENEKILYSFNSSLYMDSQSLSNENNYNNYINCQNEINLNLNEKKELSFINNVASNENSFTDNSNNKSNQIDNNHDCLNKNEKQNDDSEYLFPSPKKNKK